VQIEHVPGPELAACTAEGDLNAHLVFEVVTARAAAVLGGSCAYIKQG